MEVQFNNVIISVEAETPKEAYTKLCETLKDLEFYTDTFVVEGSSHERSTEELVPDVE